VIPGSPEQTPTGSLELHAARAGPHTVLRRLRYDGTLRCSRAFPHEAAALVVTSQLGPGIVHGDRLRLHGTLDERAHLIVTAQSATRIMGGEHTSVTEARWSVAAGALLELIGEPLVPSPGARLQATTRITLAPTSTSALARSSNETAASASTTPWTLRAAHPAPSARWRCSAYLRTRSPLLCLRWMPPA
jgi:urease accessory protein UreH